MVEGRLSWPAGTGADARDALAEVFAVVGDDLRRIVGDLRELGYIFHGDPLPGPDRERYHAVERPRYVERCNEEPPLALDVFWEVIGPVDLVGRFVDRHPPIHSMPSRPDVVYADPLRIYDVADATRETYWKRWTVGETDGSDAFVDLCQDAHHKAGFGGGDPVLIHLPAAPDPVIIDGAGMWPAGTTFMGLLRTSMAWAGLPGLRHAATIPWLDVLRRPFAERYGET